MDELQEKLLTLCLARKYKSKGDIWIGFGSIKNSKQMVDVTIFNSQKRQFDQQLEELSKIMLE